MAKRLCQYDDCYNEVSGRKKFCNIHVKERLAPRIERRTRSIIQPPSESWYKAVEDRALLQEQDKEYKIVIKANGQYDKNKIQVLYKYWP